MSVIHFLNVKDGDCSIIEHNSGRVTVMDVCNAKAPEVVLEEVYKILAAGEKGIQGNFNQKAYPVNPISYFKEHGIGSIHRFVLSHPDMDHLDGIESFFKAYPPSNFWDTNNSAKKEFGNGSNGGYS